jgi:ADP-ribose pyrophosphatase YjhB (NUDIX family)
MKYVLGFYFSEDKTQVALIRKNKPIWQKNHLNGIGGKIEPNEHANDAMVREFKEEAGIEVLNWRKFCTLFHFKNVVNCYVAFGNLENIKSLTDEEVSIFNVNQLNNEIIMPNLLWLIPLALDSDEITAQIFDKSKISNEEKTYKIVVSVCDQGHYGSTHCGNCWADLEKVTLIDSRCPKCGVLLKYEGILKWTQ